MILESWIKFLFALAIGTVIICVSFIFVKYLRLIVKRMSLLIRLKRTLKKRDFLSKVELPFFTSLFSKKLKCGISIRGGKRIFNVYFFACKNRKNAYTFTDIGSYYTSHNTRRMFISYDYPSHGQVLKTSAEQKLHMPRTLVSDNTEYRKKKKIQKTQVNDNQDVVNILCFNPLPSKIYIVRSNRQEDVFDGIEFKGYLLFSGNGLCKYIESISENNK